MEERARVAFTLDGERFAIELTIGGDGRPLSFVMPRRSDANPEKRFRWQPFGGRALETGRFGGYRIPVRLEAGNHFGTNDYFPFFVADITAARFLAAS